MLVCPEHVEVAVAFQDGLVDRLHRQVGIALHFGLCLVVGLVCSPFGRRGQRPVDDRQIEQVRGCILLDVVQDFFRFAERTARVGSKTEGLLIIPQV